MKSTVNKDFLKKLIKEVISEIGNDTDVLKHTSDFEKNRRDTVIKLKTHNLKDGQIKKILSRLAWEAKKQDLDVIDAEVERDGKEIASMDANELRNVIGDEDEDNFDTTQSKSITRKTSREKPPLSVSSEDWKNMERRDLLAAREKQKLKNAKIKAGTYDPNDTSLWTDDDWDRWEKENNGTVSKLK